MSEPYPLTKPHPKQEDAAAILALGSDNEWKAAGGRLVKIKDMETGHLNNVYIFLTKKYAEQVATDFHKPDTFIEISPEVMFPAITVILNELKTRGD